MEGLYYIVSSTVLLVLGAVDTALLVRAVLSWIMPDVDGPIFDILYFLTEPVIIPYRKLFERFRWFEGSPIVMPFIFAVATVGILSTVLYLGM